jgi:hypothetical protein
MAAGVRDIPPRAPTLNQHGQLFLLKVRPITNDMHTVKTLFTTDAALRLVLVVKLSFKDGL